MAVTFIGSGSAEATTVTLGAHQKGDLVIGYAYRHDNNNAPRTPSSPARWSALGLSPTGNTQSGLAAYMICESNSEVFGTWANCTSVGYLIYRSANVIFPVRTMTSSGFADGQKSGATSTFTWGGCVPIRNSWVVGVGGIRTIDTDINTPPVDMVNRVSRVGATNGHLVMHDTNGEVASRSSGDLTLTGTAAGWGSFVFHIFETNISL